MFKDLVKGLLVPALIFAAAIAILMGEAMMVDSSIVLVHWLGIILIAAELIVGVVFLGTGISALRGK